MAEHGEPIWKFVRGGVVLVSLERCGTMWRVSRCKLDGERVTMILDGHHAERDARTAYRISVAAWEQLA